MVGVGKLRHGGGDGEGGGVWRVRVGSSAVRAQSETNNVRRPQAVPTKNENVNAYICYVVSVSCPVLSYMGNGKKRSAKNRCHKKMGWCVCHKRIRRKVKYSNETATPLKFNNTTCAARNARKRHKEGGCRHQPQ